MRGPGLLGLKIMRERAGMTQEELATAIGVTKQAISRWENPGHSRSRWGHLPALAQALNCTLDDLFCPVNLYEDGGDGDGAVKKS